MKFSKIGLMSLAALVGASFAFAGKASHKSFDSRRYGIKGESGGVYDVELFDNANKRCDASFTTLTCSVIYTSPLTVSTITASSLVDPQLAGGKYVAK